MFWKGYGDVKFEGETTSKIDTQKVSELVDVFERTNFFLMSDFDDEYVTDHPWANTSITLYGISKTVSHYYGDEKAPLELYELECEIDEVANTNQWMGWEGDYCREWIEYITK